MELPSDFCPECGTLVDIPQHGDYIECHRCNSKYSIKEYPSKPIISILQFNQKKPWLD